MKIACTICFVLMLSLDFSAQNTLSDINSTANNALKVIGLFSKNETKNESQESESLAKYASEKPSKKPRTARNQQICREFCVENMNKKNAKVEIEFQSTGERESLLVMSKDKSCVFDMPLGVYTIRVYQEDRLTKKTDFRIQDSEQETIKLPE
jgi:hypothetical protein